MKYFCCDQMGRLVSDSRVALEYDSVERRWSILVIDWMKPIEKTNNLKENIVSAWQGINFCPWCGSKLPKSLMDERDSELEALGYCDSFDEGIPEEFKTDEWWKKRNL